MYCLKEWRAKKRKREEKEERKKNGARSAEIVSIYDPYFLWTPQEEARAQRGQFLKF